MSYAWYDIPLQGEDGRVWQIRASGVLRTARVKNEGKNGEALGDSPGGITGPAQVGVRRLDHRSRQPGPQAREHPGLARKKAEGKLPSEEHGGPRGLRQDEDWEPRPEELSAAFTAQQPTGECIAPVV